MNSVSNESATNALDNEAFMKMLSRPLGEINKENNELRFLIKRGRKNLDEWIVSQEAFRSLASKFRIQLGISDEDIRLMIKESHEKAVHSCQEKGLLK